MAAHHGDVKVADEYGKAQVAIGCVIMGARHLLSGKGPDLVLSGVNRGSNVGEDVIYSGTVAGAVEGTMLGIPSLALSQAFRSVSGGEPHWETSLLFAPDITRRIVGDIRA